jgi:hypothetical protein
MDRKLKEARVIALNKGIIKLPEQLQISKAKNKRFVIVTNDGMRINFGQWMFSGKGTFLDNRDEIIKKAWQARHSKIMKAGKPAYLDKTSPEYYAWRILWSA